MRATTEVERSCRIAALASTPSPVAMAATKPGIPLTPIDEAEAVAEFAALICCDQVRGLNGKALFRACFNGIDTPQLFTFSKQVIVAVMGLASGDNFIQAFNVAWFKSHG